MVKDLVGFIDFDFFVDEINNFEVVGGDYFNDWVKNEILLVEEMNVVENSSVYWDLRKEIVDFIFLEVNVLDVGGFGGDNDQSNIFIMFFLIEDNMILKLMEGYICMFSKYIVDVSGVSNFDNVDYRLFIIELDDFVVYFDDCLKYYLDNLNKNFFLNLVLDFKLLFCILGERLSLFLFRVVYFSIMDLLYRYVCFLMIVFVYVLCFDRGLNGELGFFI